MRVQQEVKNVSEQEQKIKEKRAGIGYETNLKPEPALYQDKLSGGIERSITQGSGFKAAMEP